MTYYKNKVKSILFFLGCVFLIYITVQSKDSINDILSSVQWTLFIASTITSLIASYIASIFYHNLTIKHGIDISKQLSTKLFFYSQIVKYIPGKIWIIFYQKSMSGQKKSGVDFLNINIDLTAAIIILSATSSSILLAYTNSLIYIIFFILATGILIFTIIIKSYLISNIINKIFKKKSEIKKIPWSTKLWKEAVYSCAFIIISMLSNILLLTSIFGLSINDLTAYSAYLGLAWIAGTIIFIIPSGLGIKELVFIFLAQQNQALSGDLIIAMAIMHRFWTMLQEIILAICVFLWSHVNKKRNHNTL